jgi:surfeit locus 1 family protein
MLGYAPMLRSLLTPRWILGMLLALLVAAGCVELGLWQLRRLDERRTFNTSVERAIDSNPRPLNAFAATSGADALAYRRVRVNGTYDTRREVVLFGRTLNGEPGNEVLTPLVTADGSAVVVDRGWVPLASDTPPVSAAAPPAGAVSVTGILWPPEAESEPDPSAPPERQLAKIDLGRLQQQLPYRIARAYLWLQSQQPSQAGPLPRPVPLPPLDEGPHLSYAVQWFIFAAIAVVGYAVLARRELVRARPDIAAADEATREEVPTR